MVDKAENFTNGSLSKATDSVMSALDRHKGTISDQEITNAITVAKRLDANGTHAQAGDIYSKLDEHLREHGRAVQAASVLSRRTPEGLHYGAIKELKKHGVNVTPELAKNISEKIKQIKGSEQGSLERNLHIKELQKMVADNVPSDRADKLTGIWKAGLLSGIRTQTGNALSNETFSILHNISNLAAVPLDKAASLITHSRTKTLTGRGLVKGTGEGYKQGYNYLKTGIDERAPLENKYLQGKQLNFKNKAINTYVNGIFRLMGAADRPHYYRQLRNSLYDLGKADGLNQGLKGKALRDHMEEFAKNPPEDKFQLATNEAEQAVLANDTLLSKAAGRIQKLTEEAKTPVGKFVAKVAVNGIAPFTKVPSAFISRVIDFTPAGALKEVVTQISRKHFDQRALVTAIAEAGTGYALMSVGSSLAQNGLISGNYPNDPKEQQRWKAQGIQPNSVKVGDNWYSLNYFGPVGMLFAAGSRINDAKQNGGGFVSQQAAAYGGMPKDLTEQSFLQGLNNSLEAINEPGRYLNNLVKSNVSSVVPTIVNDVATATDKLQRQSDNAVDAVKSRVPGLRETLKPAQDVYGNQLPRKTGTLGTLVNPLRPSKSITNSVKSEVERLHNADPTNSDLQVTPTPVGKTLTVEGNKIALTNQQRYDLQTTVGNTVQSEWGKLIKTPEYKALDDAGKAKALSNLRSDATSVATRQFATQNNLATYKKGLTAKQSALGNGSDVSSYATNANNTGSVTIAPNLDKQSSSVLTKYNAMSSTDRAKTFNTQPSAEYDYYRAKYNNDKANGALSDVQDIRARKSLAKDKVGSVYPKTVRDLYGLSKADISAYLSTSEKGVDKQKLAKQLIAYDQALHNAGLSSYLKFKTGIAPSKKRSGGSKKKASGIKPSASLESIIKAAAAIKAPTSPAASKPKATAYQKTALKGYTTKYPSQKGAPVTVRRGIV